MTQSQDAAIVSVTCFCAAVSALFSGAISDKIGRKPVILIADVIFLVGAIVMAIAPTITVLIVGRAIIGLGVGSASQIVPLYLSEVSPDEIRGKLVAANMGITTFG